MDDASTVSTIPMNMTERRRLLDELENAGLTREGAQKALPLFVELLPMVRELEGSRDFTNSAGVASYLQSIVRVLCYRNEPGCHLRGVFPKGLPGVRRKK